MDHKGEQEARILTGEQLIGDRNSRIIADRLSPGAIYFIQRQPFFVASSLDEKGGVCTSMVTGKDGFIKVADEKTIVIDQQLVNSNPYDVFWPNIMINPNLGLLFMETSSRRRFRVNGKIRQDGDYLFIDVDQAYANCPKYIQQRLITSAETSTISTMQNKEQF